MQPVENRAASLIKNELVCDSVRQHGSVRIRVQGSSMLPSLRPGDEVNLQSIPLSTIKIGDIIAYQRDGRLFVHRVIANDPAGQLLTRGDTLLQADAPVSGDELLGVIEAAFRDGKKIDYRATAAGRVAATIFRRVPLCAAVFVKLTSNPRSFAQVFPL